MVRIQNKQGEFKRGKQEGAVYQGFYGRQIRRKREDKKKTKSQKQLEVQKRFKQGLAFAKSLSIEERKTLQSYISSHALNLTWHNYAKLISMAPVKIDSTSLYRTGSATFPTAMQAWKCRRAVNVVNSTGISWTNFPVLIQIQGNDPLGANFVDFSIVKPGGDDIRFTRTDSAAFFTYGIESWDASGKAARIWLLVDSLPALGTVPIFLYYFNPAASPASDLPAVFYG